MVNDDGSGVPPPWTPPPGAVPPSPSGMFRPPAPPPRRRPRWLVPVVVAGALVAVSCVGAAGYGVVRAADALTPGPASERGLSGTAPGSSGDGAEEAEEISGPRASSYPVRAEDDLKRVCDQWYYPQAPKYEAGDTNPVSVLVDDSLVLDTRTAALTYAMKYDIPGATEKAWEPSGPTVVRLVACVDLVGKGTKVGSCTFDEPKTTVPMRQGVYRMALYEVATGRKLVDRRVTGESEDCPFLVLLTGDRTVYSKVNERQMFEAFRTYAEK